MKIIKYALVTLLFVSSFGCGKPAKSGSVTMMVTANVRGQLDPCG